jgi:hypothetical protein
MRCGVLLTCLVLAACASSNGNAADAGGGAADAGADAWLPGDSGPPASYAAVYAHSRDQLFRIDPDNLQPALVAGFSFTGEARNITDIALDRDGNMIGISLGQVYAIDRETAVATWLSDIDGPGFTSLSYVPEDPTDLQSAEILVAADFDGEVYEIDPQDGSATPLGNYGAGIGSSGDIVSVRGFGTVATVTVEGETTDWLAWVDPTTWEATVIGDTGVEDIFGLAFWGGTIYGFTDDNRFVAIAVDTGAATTIESGAISWWGAGVTTIAPVVE